MNARRVARDHSGSPFLDSLYRRYRHIVYDAALPIVRNHGDAEEVVHRVILKLRAELLIEMSEACLLSYLRQAGKHEALRVNAAYGRHVPLTDEHASMMVANVPDQCDEIIKAELHSDVWRMINRLPPRCSLVLGMIVGEGFTHPEVSEHLGIGVKAVEKQVERAYRMFRAMPEFHRLHSDWS